MSAGIDEMKWEGKGRENVRHELIDGRDCFFASPHFSIILSSLSWRVCLLVGRIAVVGSKNQYPRILEMKEVLFLCHAFVGNLYVKFHVKEIRFGGLRDSIAQKVPKKKHDRQARQASSAWTG